MTGPDGAYDVVLIGSGLNSLVCAALLTRKGKRVCVLERADVAGGCIRTEALTLPGFLHDTLSTLYPLFVTTPYFKDLEPVLAAKGVRFLNSPCPTAVVLPDGASLIFRCDRNANITAMEALHPGDGVAYAHAMAEVEANAPLIFGVLGAELWTFATLKLLVREICKRGPRGFARFAGDRPTCRTQGANRARVLHVGLSPESPLSAQMDKVVMFSLEQVGSPMVEGGGAQLVKAFCEIIADGGGVVRTGADVAEIVTSKGVATGVRLEGGETIPASQAVVANVTPTQLYGRLLKGDAVPAPVRADAAAFRYGRGEMQIHLALSEPPQWPDPDLLHVGMLHLTGGVEAVSKAVNQAESGLLPELATIVVAQPVAIDPSRAPSGAWIFWIQLQELPRDGQLRGDAAGQIAVAADGRWTPAIRDAYADRIVARLCAQIPNLEQSILSRHVISPADLEALNMNLVGGDPYSGSCGLDQYLLWRPSPNGRNHETSVKGLYQIGASTHPGPGLGGMSGYLVAQRLR
jgi:phytoene dehydrogenase-like protein